jgi:hypothetical protein
VSRNITVQLMTNLLSLLSTIQAGEQLCLIFAMRKTKSKMYTYIQGVSEGIVNILGSGSTDYSE